MSEAGDRRAAYNAASRAKHRVINEVRKRRITATEAELLEAARTRTKSWWASNVE